MPTASILARDYISTLVYKYFAQTLAGTDSGFIPATLCLRDMSGRFFSKHKLDAERLSIQKSILESFCNSFFIVHNPEAEFSLSFDELSTPQVSLPDAPAKSLSETFIPSAGVGSEDLKFSLERFRRHLAKHNLKAIQRGKREELAECLDKLKFPFTLDDYRTLLMACSRKEESIKGSVFERRFYDRRRKPCMAHKIRSKIWGRILSGNFPEEEVAHLFLEKIKAEPSFEVVNEAIRQWERVFPHKKINYEMAEKFLGELEKRGLKYRTNIFKACSPPAARLLFFMITSATSMEKPAGKIINLLEKCFNHSVLQKYRRYDDDGRICRWKTAAEGEKISYLLDKCVAGGMISIKDMKKIVMLPCFKGHYLRSVLCSGQSSCGQS